jgi:hypothetical protein
MNWTPFMAPHRNDAAIAGTFWQNRSVLPVPYHTTLPWHPGLA